jgi:polyhydroxyalkanoate synthesis regulator phasin
MSEQEVRRLKQRLLDIEAELARIKASCPKYTPDATCGELDELSDEVKKLRREMRDIARRLSHYEDVTGRFTMPELDDDDGKK